ncbi:hypothetical protein CB1_000853018 [Camelus ferus]|nr:hypothetical protein CB1_000853018 [Camelus ferus]
MEWKLERTARRRVRTEEEMLWENVMRVLAKDVKQKRSQGSPKVFDAVNPTYSNFKSDFAKRLSAEVPVASSPITTRWRQSQTRDLAAHSFGEEHSTTDLPQTTLKATPEKETLIPGSYKEPLKTPNRGNFGTINSALCFCKEPHALDGSWKENVASKGQKCLNQLFSTQKVAQHVNGKMQLCEQSQCVWKAILIGLAMCLVLLLVFAYALHVLVYLQYLDWHHDFITSTAHFPQMKARDAAEEKELLRSQGAKCYELRSQQICKVYV